MLQNWRMRWILCLTLCAAAFSLRAAPLSEPLVFTGACDASGAVGFPNGLFVVANDEDNILRFYRASQPGKPVQTFDLNPIFTSKKKSPEADLEGAAQLGSRLFFIASHGRNKDGKYVPARHRFFALDIADQSGEVQFRAAGLVYSNLVADLARDPNYRSFRLAEASEHSPETRGALNIEALAATPAGGLLIGFRSPIPGRRALIAPLLNPDEVIAGKPPRFAKPLELDLNGLGLRDMGWTGQEYYLIAGPDDGGAVSRLYSWSGEAAPPRLIEAANFSGINPEGICFLNVGVKNILILSDDGTRRINGQDCKDLPEAERQFRAYRFSP